MINYRTLLGRNRPDAVRSMGRGTDTMMGHLTPGEGVIPVNAWTPELYGAYQDALDRQGMAPEQYIVGNPENSTNPMTGQPEFLAQAAAPGRSVRDYQERTGSSNPTGREAREGGGGAPPLTQTQIDAYTNPTTGYGPTRGAAEARPDLLEEDWVTDPSGSGLWGSMKETDLSPLMHILPGPLGAMMEVAGVNPVITTFEAAVPPGGYNERRSSLGRESENKWGLSASRAATQQSFMRPMEMPTPNFLGLTSAMTPLQQRSAIASRGVAGQGGAYTSPEAQEYYSNLLQRALIGESGDLAGLDTLLPIDMQFLAQVMGIENPADTSALLSALAA